MVLAPSLPSPPSISSSSSSAIYFKIASLGAGALALLLPIMDDPATDPPATDLLGPLTHTLHIGEPLSKSLASLFLLHWAQNYCLWAPCFPNLLPIKLIKKLKT